jgi:hypothetical protein
LNKLKSFSQVFIAGLLLLGFSTCDETPGNVLDQSRDTVVQSMTLTPSLIDFQRSDGIKDTVVNITVSAVISAIDLMSGTRSPEVAVFRLGAQGEAEFRGNLQAVGQTGNFEATFGLSLNTLDFKQFEVFTYVYDESGNSNWVSRRLRVEGFANAAPQILEVDNPAEVTIPSGPGAIPVSFTAKVTDEDGQNTIREVQILFENEDGSILTPSPNLLRDDGSSESGDLAAGDSVFTITFQIDQNNTPSNRQALYFAIDNAGLSSDTLSLPFNILDNR